MTSTIFMTAKKKANKPVIESKLHKISHSMEATCYHEAGHAGMYYYFGFGSPIQKIKIYNFAEGMVYPTPYPIRNELSKKAAIITALAGWTIKVWPNMNTI